MTESLFMSIVILIFAMPKTLNSLVYLFLLVNPNFTA